MLKSIACSLLTFALPSFHLLGTLLPAASSPRNGQATHFVTQPATRLQERQVPDRPLHLAGIMDGQPLPPIAVLASTPLQISKQAPRSIVANSELMTPEILQQSWDAYRQRFIQADGRVIDWEAEARTVSEGQAYAMLRAVLADDHDTFERTFRWAENNLKVPVASATHPPNLDSAPAHSLWAWKWGQTPQGDWGILDANFASDADLDAITALILASRRWNRPDYLTIARTKLVDLWHLSSLEIAAGDRPTQRYFLPGPLTAFRPTPDQLYLNPSYLAPYAFRLFAQVDPNRDWLSLVDSSYAVLTDSTQISPVRLPADWIMLNLKTGQFRPTPAEFPLRSVYSFDAFRVWWRVSWDASWFQEPRAQAFLEQHLVHLAELWRSNQMIPARISLRGRPLVPYEATAQYAMLYPAFQSVDRSIAAQIRQQKLLTTYDNGIWDNDSAYYVQNLAWLGLFPAAEVNPAWLRPNSGAQNSGAQNSGAQNSGAQSHGTR